MKSTETYRFILRASFVLALFVLSSFAVVAQEDGGNGAKIPVKVPKADSSRVAQPNAIRLSSDSSKVAGKPTSVVHSQETAPRKKDMSTDTAVREHNPNISLALSAVLPGAGQVYNHQAWKIPIIYAALGGVGYYTWNNYTLMKQHKDEYLYRVNNGDAMLDPELAGYPTANVYSLYESYNKTFQLSIIIGVAVYGLNLLDAYIFGHLYDFEIDDDLAFSIRPTFEPLAFTTKGLSAIPGLSLSLRF